MDNNLLDILRDSLNEQKRINRRMFILILVLVGLLLFTNTSWLIYESQFSDVASETEMSADNAGFNVYGNSNDIKEWYYGRIYAYHYI